ncbi:DNA helicase [Gracilaria domingensis]|nr:DNA helicase [Gracilaria domingensis]
MLFLYRSQVSRYNEKVLEGLSGKLHHCHARDTYVPGNSEGRVSRRTLIKRLQKAAPDIVSVKVGAAVLLTRKPGSCLPGKKLIISDIVLAPSGNVECLKYRVENERHECVLKRESFSVRDRDTSILASRAQFPVIPAYAVTIHKCQGLTLQNVAVEFISSSWKPVGMVYVALSRCESLEGLWVSGLTKEHVRTNIVAEKYMKYIRRLQIHYPSRVISEINPFVPITTE